jgi:hypothetical protein
MWRACRSSRVFALLVSLALPIAGSCGREKDGSMAPYAIGYPVELPASSDSGGGYLFGFKVAVPRMTILKKFGLISRRANITGVMALYRNTGTQPDTLVASTAVFTTVTGVMELDPTTATALSAGEYWLCAAYSANMSVAQGPINYEEDSRYRMHSLESPLPDPFGTASTEQAQKINYYIIVED